MLILKSIFQSLLISAKLTLEQDYPLTHIILNLLFLSLYLGIVGKYGVFTYPAANLWYCLMVLAVWIYGGVGMMEAGLPGRVPGFVWWVILGGLYACLIALGVLIPFITSKYRLLLKRKKAPDRSDIIKFAFTFGNLAMRHLANFRAKQQIAQENQQIRIYISS